MRQGPGFTPPPPEKEKKIESRDQKRSLHTHVIAALFTIARRWKLPHVPQWKRKNVTYTYNAILFRFKKKRKEILAATQANLGNVKLSETSQSQRQTLYNSTYVSFPEESNSQTQKAEPQLPGAGEGGVRRKWVTA
jgi:hypothetical protein